MSKSNANSPYERIKMAKELRRDDIASSRWLKLRMVK
jgi:hypothetical protein